MVLEQLIPLREASMRVELDKRALFALASDTRLDILKSLQPMRRTVTQLAETLGIDKAAVHRHLKTLEEGGFVKRYEDHGFVYYGLSWKSRDILSPNENTKIIILLSASLVFIGAVALVLAAAYSTPGVLPDFDRYSPDSSTDAGSEGSEDGSPEISLFFLLAVVAAVALSLATVVMARGATKIVHRPRQPGMGPEGPE